jgi:hypothetical protein
MRLNLSDPEHKLILKMMETHERDHPDFKNYTTFKNLKERVELAPWRSKVQLDARIKIREERGKN